jgi:membrane protein
VPRPHPLDRLRSIVERTLQLAEVSLERLVAIQFVDRSVALGSLAFTALVPLLLIAAAYVPGSDALSDDLIERFHLSGSSADLVRQVFAQPDDVRQSVSWLGLVLLIASSLSFTRALQRVYEHAWRLDSRGLRGTRAGLTWLAGVVLWVTVFATVRRWLIGLGGPAVAFVVLLGGNAIVWLWSPHVLLAHRVAWQRLVPSAALTSVAMSAISVGSVVYMPQAIEDSASAYGPIGIAIALVSWLVAIGFALVACAGVGAVLGEALTADRSA